MGMFLAVLGVIVYLVAGVLLLVKAFKVSVAWGLGTLLLPFVAFIFVAQHWDETKYQFLGVIAGAVMFFAGMALLPAKTTPPRSVAAYDAAVTLSSTYGVMSKFRT